MATWKKHFQTLPRSQKLKRAISQAGDNIGRDVTGSKYSSYLPEVYAGQPNRLERYSQFDQMDLDSEVNSSLNIIADTCTQINDGEDTPFSVKFLKEASESEVEIIHKSLRQWTFMNDFKTRIWRIFRNVLKYGDQFFVRDPETYKWLWVDHNKVDSVVVNEAEGKKIEEYVVTDMDLNLQTLVASKIHNKMSSQPFEYTNPAQVGDSSKVGGYGTPANYVRSQQSGGLGAASSLDGASVIHISMSEGLDGNWPFGISILESVFRTFKQKELLEDAIIIYRIQRAPERRVFKIDVGNMPAHKAAAYIERVKNEIHQRRIPNRTGGGQCLRLTTEIPLLDGRTLELNELIEEFKQGKKNWAYSINPETKEIVPGPITWAGVTRHNAEILELELDNGEKLYCTPDHKIPVQGRGYVEAKDINVNVDSLYAFNQQLAHVRTGKQDDDGYHQVFSNNHWQFTHRLVHNFMEKINKHQIFEYQDDLKNKKKDTVHHADFDRLNNNPDNLLLMNNKDHFLYHKDHNSEKWKKMPKHRLELMKQRMTEGYTDWYHNKATDEEKQQKIDKWKKTMANKSQEEKKEYSKKLSKNIRHGWANFKENKKEQYKKFVEGQSQRLKERHTDKLFVKKLQDSLKHQQQKPWANNKAVFNDTMVDIFKSIDVTGSTTIKEIRKILAKTDFMKEFRKVNQGQNHIDKIDYSMLSEPMFNKFLNFMGYDSWGEYKTALGLTLRVKSQWSKECFDILVDYHANGINQQREMIRTLKKSEEFAEAYEKTNSGTPFKQVVFSKFKMTNFLNAFGFDNWKHFTENVDKYNHKVVAIRRLDEKEDVGTITIDGNEELHNHHNFAIGQGIFVKNSVMDAAYNPLCIDLSTKIPLLDGRTLELSQLIKEYQVGKENWIYSCDPTTGKLCPAPITWAGVTRKNAQVIKIHLDNGKHLICTPDHKIPVLGKGFKEAKDLSEDDSLISFQREYQSIDRSNNGPTYEKVYDHSSNSWEYTHRMVGEFFRKQSKHQEFTYLSENAGKLKTVIHHKDYDRYNNDPRNLQYMDKEDHIMYHSLNKKDFWENAPKDELDRIRNKISNTLLESWNSLSEEEKEIRRENTRRAQRLFVEKRKTDSEFAKQYNEQCRIRMKKHIQDNPEFKVRLLKNVEHQRQSPWANVEMVFTQDMLTRIIEITRENDSNRLKTIELCDSDEKLMTLFRESNPEVPKGISKIDRNKWGYSKLKRILEQFGYKNWKDFKKKIPNYNHRIVKIEYLDELVDVGTITVDGNERWTKNHTFAIDSEIFIKNSVLEDYFLSQTSDGRGSSIETLPGGENLGEIGDLQYFDNKLKRGLGVPSSYLPTGPEDGQAQYSDGRVGTAYIQEYRFTKYCERLQRIISRIFDDEFKIFLKARGLNIDSSLFEIEFNSPQNFAKYRQIELDSQQINIFQPLSDMKIFSKRFVMKRYLGLTDEEVIENERMWKEENPQVFEGKEAPDDQQPGLSDVGVRADNTPGGDISGDSDGPGADNIGADSPISGDEGDT